MAINFNNQNKGIGTLDLSEYGLLQPEENMTVAEVFNTPQSLMELGAVEPGKMYGYNLTDQGEVLEDFRNSAVNMRNAPASPTYNQDVQSQLNRMLGMPGLAGDVIENKDFIQDAINKGFLKTPEDFKNQKSFADPDDLQAMAISNYEQLFGPRTMTDANQSLYTGMMDQSGTPIDYTDRIMNPNLPGFAYQPKESLRNIIGSQLQNAKTNVGQKVGQGFDFAQQIPGMILSAATGIPFAGQIAQGIGGLLGNVFQESPEQKNFRENIATDPEYQNLVSQIPGMSNYNQIFGTGSGRGLLGAIDKRLATLARTEKRQGVNFSDTLKERRKKLEALREIERQKESAFLESQRRGRAPTAPSGGGTRDNQGDRSRGQTGGYSYDSGGRQGFGYGLKDGGLASMFTRRG
jgi:hypothetical protein